MWAQLVKARIKPGSEDQLRQTYEELARRGPQGSGWIRSFSLRNQNDPHEMYSLVIFESEAKAREYERSPQQAELVGRLREFMEGPPDYVDFDVLAEYSP
ncbi:MAG: antibiotic biosynthesis monooxygenase [Chloroflexota bacterium]|nr:antibiotic biosynthesis monooxygenase [Chloroflexota bacterium]